jgi:hypothetical protein
VQVDSVRQAFLLDADQYRACTQQAALELQNAQQICGTDLELDSSQAVGFAVVPHRSLEIFVPVGEKALIRK